MSNWLREHNRQIVAVCLIVTMLLTALNSLAIAEQRDRLTREIDLLWAGVDIVLTSQQYAIEVLKSGVCVGVDGAFRIEEFVEGRPVPPLGLVTFEDCISGLEILTQARLRAQGGFKP